MTRRKSPTMSPAFIRGVSVHLPNAAIAFDKFKGVARMIRRHIDGIVAWVRSRQTNGFPETINGLFQAAKYLTTSEKRGVTRA